MSSGDCKEELVRLYKGTKIADWKRASKKKLDGQDIRVFVNAVTGDEVTVTSPEDDDAYDFYDTGPDSPMLFYVADGDMDGMLDDDEDGTFVMFAPKKFWERNHYIPDWHMEWYLLTIAGAPQGLLEELSENQFLANDTLENTKAKLEAAGMVFEPEMARAGQWDN